MIIVYGGTFNPPTIAHEKIANMLIKKYEPEKFIFLPVGDYYTWKDNLASFEDRKKMLELAFLEPIFIISDLENNNEYKGSYWALNKIKNTYKNGVYFLMGADNLDQLDKWINYKNLLTEFKFLIITRAGYNPIKIINEKYQEFKDTFEIVEINIDISSTQFRNNLNDGSILNKKVYDYIKKNNLYGTNTPKVTD